MSEDLPIVGRTLAGRFRVLAFIGEGGMATVYRAVQEGEPRDVALKILHPHLVSDGTFVRRFRREAKAAARIVHPSSVRILDTGVDGNLLYIAMELLSGVDLFELLVVERRLAEARAARIVADVADALATAHANGVIHRDLKPENVMLVPDDDSPNRERVKVLDFGIAKVLEPDATPDGMVSMQTALTGVDSVVGTPAYMSPEQCRGEALDHRSDIYACGVLLYQLLTGRLPFVSSSTMEVAVMHVRTPPAPLETLVPGVNPKLAELVLATLGKWPDDRPATAIELRDRLRALAPFLSPRPLTLVTEDAPSSMSRGLTESRRVTQAAPSSTARGDAGPPSASPEELAPSSAVRAHTSMTTLVQTRAKAARKARVGVRPWLIVPLALFIGLLAGAVAFVLVRR